MWCTTMSSRALLALLCMFAVAWGGSNCPGGTTQIDTFVVNATEWVACEDLTIPAGALVLVRADGRTEWFPKSYSMYGSSHDEDPSYYLGLGKQNVTQAAADILGMAMLAQPEITLSLVADAVPPIKGFGGARTFVGSRGSVADTTFDSSGEDASQYGFPPAASFVFNLSNIAEGGSPVHDRNQYVNNSGMAEGLVGGELPAVIFYYPVMHDSPYLSPTVAAANRSRYWTMVAVGAPDMQGSREQCVMFRFQQLECDGAGASLPSAAAMAPATADTSCHLVGAPMYWDTFWWSRAPPGASGATNATGPLNATSSNDFYRTLLETRQWWDSELTKEGMMELVLPSDTHTSTNGTWLVTEARHNLILSMITKHDTWGPRYGVLPGYGITMQNGFEDVFTSTAQAALEIGAMDYARGLIENQFAHYIMDNGMTKYRAIEVAQQARMLTILALFHAYAGGSKDDDDFLLRHFKRAKSIADWLVARRNRSLARYNASDPRYGLIAGNDEGDDFTHIYFHQGDPYTLHQFWYGHTAEAYRAFVEIGQTWSRIGIASGRADVAAHGTELLALAPKLYASLHASLDMTRNTTASPGHVCYSDDAGMFGTNPSFGGGCAFRSYSELFHSGALTEEQTDAMYISGQGNTTCPVGRWLTNGSPSGGGADPLIFVHIPQGLPFGLLTHDMVDRFLLYFFHQAAHANTRGTFTTPESTKLDRNGGGYAYASAGLGNVPMALKWMMCFEEMETRTLWLAKATPRDWLATSARPVMASRLATRYGRIAFSLNARETSAGVYSVRANITLPASFGNTTSLVPAGGIRLRLRVPLTHAGKLTNVSVGGRQWAAFSAAEETVDFSADTLANSVFVTEGLQNIVATFASHTRAQAVPLRRARIDLRRRVVPILSDEIDHVESIALAPGTKATPEPELMASGAIPHCPDDSTLVDSFVDTGMGDNIVWSACEDIQRPGGDIVLVSSHVPVPHIERFSKSFAPFTTNWTDDEQYYLGLGKQIVANATTDLMGAKLLADHREGGLSWSAVERAIPVIRRSGKRGDGRWGSNCQGVRTFVGSRSAAVDTTFDDHGGDCNWEGWPSWESYAVNMHNKAMGAPMQTYNGSISADGNVGDELPTVIFYLPMHDNGTSMNRYWTYFAVAVPDQCPEPANGCREQNVLFRFQQVECAGPMGNGAGGPKAPCKMIDWPMYWDSYWFSRFPGANKSDTSYQTLLTGPVNATSSSDFYSTLLASRRWWKTELAKEGMMELRDLPSPATTNGTWLALQARQAIVRSMITRENKWHPRYGVRPGYGDIVHDGLLSVFVSTATAALEYGAMEYARGVVDNHFQHYVRNDGMVWYRSIELPATARMLTVLAKYHSYAYNDGDSTFADALLLRHFSKARAVATLLLARRSASAELYNSTDPRHGIPQGGIEARDGDDIAHINQDTLSLHWYASAAELYRACTDLGAVWYDVGRRSNRSDIEAHGREMLAVAPQLHLDMHASLNKTVKKSAGNSGKPVERCWQLTAEAGASNTTSQSFGQTSFRGFAEMFYSGAMTSDQIADIYAAASGGSECGAMRFLTLGSPGLTDAPGKASLASPWSYGFAHGLLQADMVEEFLLHYFTMSAHGYTRGSYTTPESANLADRDEPAIAYTASGVVTAPTYLKWLLLYEEPETRTLWLAKAIPRDWLVPGENPLVVEKATTRYGRVSFSMAAASTDSGAYSVQVNVTLPLAATGFRTLPGLRIRIRAPPSVAGKLSSVVVGGAPWHKFDAKAETINFDAADLTNRSMESLQDVLAKFV